MSNPIYWPLAAHINNESFDIDTKRSKANIFQVAEKKSFQFKLWINQMALTPKCGGVLFIGISIGGYGIGIGTVRNFIAQLWTYQWCLQCVHIAAWLCLENSQKESRTN